TATSGAATLNNATLLAGDTARITAVGIIANDASIGAVNNVTLTAVAGDFAAPKVLVRSQNGDIAVTAANVNVAGRVGAGMAPSTGLLAGGAVVITATGA